MKFLIAGLGSIGRRHLKNLLELGQKDIVLYRTHQSTLGDEGLQGFPVEQDIRKALSHMPDAVIIANPTALHMEVAVQLRNQDALIYRETPASTTDDLQQLEYSYGKAEYCFFRLPILFNPLQELISC
jgi:predicted dehydrogenase